MAKYIHPVSIHVLGDDFKAHQARKSVNPGDDYQTPVGHRVNAVAAGKVVLVHKGVSGSGGRQVHINHAGGVQTQYLHLDEITVTHGQSVKQGQKIATSGSSANGKARGGVGPHLHLSYKVNGVNKDFQKVVNKPIAPPPWKNIKNVQKRLNAHGATLTVDGIYGNLTRAAVKRFQKQHKLVVDGIVGPATWTALSKAPTTTKPAPPIKPLPPSTKPEATVKLVDPNPSQEHLDHAADVVTQHLSPLIPLTVRKRVYEALLALSAIALAVAPIVGGELGGWFLTGGSVVGVIAGTLARINTWDPTP